MRTLMIPSLVVAIAVASSACGPQAGSLQAANDTLGAAQVNAIEFSGTGRWYQFGQAPAPNLPWPAFDVSSYTATINYAAPAARVQMTRKQTIEPGRVRPAPVEQKPDQYVSGTTAWNLAPGAAEFHLDEFVVRKCAPRLGDHRRGDTGRADQDDRIQCVPQTP